MTASPNWLCQRPQVTSKWLSDRRCVWAIPDWMPDHVAVSNSNPLRCLMTCMEWIGARAWERERESLTNWLRKWRTNLLSERLHYLLTLVKFGTSTSYCMRRRRLWFQSSVVSSSPKSRKYVLVNRTSALSDVGLPPKPDVTNKLRSSSYQMTDFRNCDFY
jgi:hypothetical protein